MYLLNLRYPGNVLKKSDQVSPDVYHVDKPLSDQAYHKVDLFRPEVGYNQSLGRFCYWLSKSFVFLSLFS